MKLPNADYEALLRAKLEPSIVRRSLARAGVVLALHEFLKSSIIASVRDFFLPEDTGIENYQRSVLDRAPNSTFEASCLWLQEMGALRDPDVQILEALKRHRHVVAHELVSYVLDPRVDIDFDLVRDAANILERLALFWVRLAIDSDERFDGTEILDEEISPASSTFVNFLLDVVDDPADQ